MATQKTLAPTNQTITIAGFQGEKPDQRQIADAEGKLADAVNALNSQIIATTLTSATDFNTLTADNTGRTSLYNGSNISLMSNIPAGLTAAWPFLLEVYKIGAGTSGYYVQQVLHVYSTAGNPFTMYVRSQSYVGSGTVWLPWQRIVLSSQLETINFQYTFTNVSAGAGAIQTVNVPNPPSGKTLQLCTVNQSSGLNLVPVWVASISRGNNTVNVQVYNARTSATDITVEIFALYW